MDDVLDAVDRVMPASYKDAQREAKAVLKGRGRYLVHDGIPMLGQSTYIIQEREVGGVPTGHRRIKRVEP